MLNLVILSRQLLTKNFPSLCQSANIIRHTLPSQNTRISDFSMRFKSVNFNDEPPSCDPDLDANRKIEFIKLEMTHLRDRGKEMPTLESINPTRWDALLKCGTVSARMKYYKYLFITEMKEQNDKIKAQKRAKSYLAFKEQQLPQDDNPHITYALGKTAMMLKIGRHTMNAWRNNRLIRAMQFGEKIIFDCSYDQHMTDQEANLAAKQLLISFSDNRFHKDPFDLHFCNVNFNSVTFNRLERYIPTLRSPTFPLNLHEGSYLDVFSKEKLVYLTPHCSNDLTDYDPNSIYIIGAMVDKGGQDTLSLSKAKELNLKMARLPLEKYLDWGLGGKSLTLDQMMKIMLSIKSTRNWDTALKHVPKRKICKDSGKCKTNFRNNVRHFECGLNSARHEQSTLTTAEKFKRKIEPKFKTNSRN